jgi:cell fate (sporulation/competence/biofilm development) regulator YlbF (YheA/YmcA/DUF963 family)
MDSAEIKKRLREFVNRITVDYEDFNHLAQFSKKLDQAEKILEYMEAKHELRMERIKENLPEQKVVATPAKKKVSKKKAESEPELVVDTDVESSDA